jgi:hypothetical protein
MTRCSHRWMVGELVSLVSWKVSIPPEVVCEQSPEGPWVWYCTDAWYSLKPEVSIGHEPGSGPTSVDGTPLLDPLVPPELLLPPEPLLDPLVPPLELLPLELPLPEPLLVLPPLPLLELPLPPLELPLDPLLQSPKPDWHWEVGP